MPSAPRLRRLLSLFKIHPSLRTKVVLLPLAPLGITLVASLIMYQALVTSASSLRHFEHQREILDAGRSLATHALGALSGLRRFALTGEEHALEAYGRASESFEKTMQALREEVADHPVQQDRLTRIDNLFDEWRGQVAEETIRTRQAAAPLLAPTVRDAYILLLRSRQRELEYRISRRDEARAPWEKAVGDLLEKLTSALSLSTSPEESGRWRRALELGSAYRQAGLDAVSAGGARSASSALEVILHDHSETGVTVERQLREKIVTSEEVALVDRLRTTIEEFLRSEEEATAFHAAAAQRTIRTGRIVAIVLPACGLLFGLLFARRVSLPILRSVDSITMAAADLASGKAAARVAVLSGDELGHMALSFNTMAIRMAERARESQQQLRMGELLQACATFDEAYAVVARMARQLFPEEDGAVLWVSESGRTLEQTVSWRGPEVQTGGGVFDPKDCWALRRSHPHGADSSNAELRCAHLDDAAPGATICFPMLSEGRPLGVFHLRSKTEAGHPPRSFDPIKQQLGAVVSEQVGLALGNLQLRATLSRQSVRDPLTGLFNRRYMEETFEREMRRAARSGHALGVILVDIDHFKWFNDDFGHDAGDVVLRDVSHLLKESLRKEDFACRYGGEEIVLVMTEASIEDVQRRAEEIRELASRYQPAFAGRPLGSLTLSFGVAAYPVHGETMEVVLRSADAALYRAKALGRDRVVVAEPPNISVLLGPKPEPARARRTPSPPGPRPQLPEA